MDDKELAVTLSMLTVQFSAMNQILMTLMMVLDPAVLKAARDTIQEQLDTLQEGDVDHHATMFALAQIDLALNGPRQKKQLSLVFGKGDGPSDAPPKPPAKKGGGIMIRFVTD